jgi:hypothetical protein
LGLCIYYSILLERGEPLGGDGNAAPPDALVD